MVVERFEVWLIRLDPTMGSEIKKTRPCVVVSPDESNSSLSTIVILPLTSTIRRYPTRIDCVFQGRQGQVAFDQIRAVDKTRLIRKLGTLDNVVNETICDLACEYFAYK